MHLRQNESYGSYMYCHLNERRNLEQFETFGKVYQDRTIMLLFFGVDSINFTTAKTFFS